MSMNLGSLYSMPFGMDSYSNQVMLNDMTGFNWFTPPFNTPMMPTFQAFPPIQMMPSFGMNDSVFNMQPDFNMQYQMPQMDMYMPNQNMNQYYENMVQNQVDYNKRTREADISLNAAQRRMRQKGLQLKEKIELNEQNQIQKAFKEYLESVRSYYGDNCSEEDLRDTALEHYQQQFGKTIQKDIRENGSGSFTAGLKQVGYLGLGDNTSAEENIAAITGQEAGSSEKHWKAAGNTTAGVAWGLAAGTGYAYKHKLPLINKIAKAPGSGKLKVILGIGAAIGGLIGWISGKIQNK